MRTLESSPTAMGLIEYMEQHSGGCEGTIKQLLDNLEDYKSAKEVNWIKSAKGLGDMLRRLKPALRQSGIDVFTNPDKKRDGFHVLITRIETEEEEVCEHRELGSETNYSKEEVEEF